MFSISSKPDKFNSSLEFVLNQTLYQKINQLISDPEAAPEEVKSNPSLLSQAFFIWFDFFIAKGKEGNLKGTSETVPDTENR